MAISVNFTKLMDLEGALRMDVTDGSSYKEAYMTYTDGKVVVYVPSQTRHDKSAELKSNSWILSEVNVDATRYKANMYSKMVALMTIEEAVCKALNFERQQGILCFNDHGYDSAIAFEELVEEIAQYVRENYKEEEDDE